MTVVLSIEKGILQHDIYSWQVLKDDLIKLEKNTNTSEIIDETLTHWLNTSTSEQRKIFVDTVFELFYSTDASTFSEISKNLSTNIPKILRKYSEISQEDKKIIMDMIKILATSYINIVKEKETIKFDNLKEEYINKSKMKIEELDKKYFNKYREN